MTRTEAREWLAGYKAGQHYSTGCQCARCEAISSQYAAALMVLKVPATPPSVQYRILSPEMIEAMKRAPRRVRDEDDESADNTHGRT